MANKAFQRTYTQLDAITKATVGLRATGVANDELATVGGRLAQLPSRYSPEPRASLLTQRYHSSETLLH